MQFQKNALKETLINSAIRENKVKEEPMDNFENNISADPLSIDASAYTIKQEPQDAQSLLCDEDCFDVSPSENLEKTLFCGCLVLNIAENGLRTFKLVCNQCKNSFSSLIDFDAHLKKSKLIDNNEKLETVVEASLQLKKESTILTKKKQQLIQQPLDEKQNIKKIDNNEDENSTDLCSSNTEDEVNEPRKKKIKSNNSETVFSINHPDSHCIIILLELLKNHAILWLPRKSTIAYGRQARTTLLAKFNEQYPKYKMTTNGLNKTIDRFKNFYQRTTTDSVSNEKKETKIKKYEEYFKICAEIDENSQKIMQKCNCCKAVFYNPQDLQIHKYKMHKIGELPYKCLRCNYGFATAQTLASHEEKHDRSKTFTCKDCGMSFYHENQLERHISKHYRQTVCEICGQIYPNSEQYRRHKSTHKTKVDDREMKAQPSKSKQTYICTICGKDFNLRKNLYTHKRNVHKKKGNTHLWAPHKDDSSNQSEGDSDDDTQKLSSGIAVKYPATNSIDTKNSLLNSFLLNSFL